MLTFHPDGSSQTAYFRGRKLHGTTVNLPPDYRGIVAVTSAAPAPKDGEPEVIDLEAPDSNNSGLPQGTLQTQAEFDEMVVWGHETAVDAAGDTYLRGVGEWLELAGKVSLILLFISGVDTADGFYFPLMTDPRVSHAFDKAEVKREQHSNLWLRWFPPTTLPAYADGTPRSHGRVGRAYHTLHYTTTEGE